MEISIAAQTVVFFKAILLGAILSVLYDFFRLIRLLTKAKRKKTAVYDSIFCLLSLIALFYFIVFTARGEARIYIAIGAFFGSSLYFMTLSKLVLRFGFGVSKVVRKIISPFNKLLKKVTNKVHQHMPKRSIEIKSFVKLKKYFDFIKK
ncbi:MAG: spore cortex biosynthesis protein YabQ [Clostridiales bacterium]|nr:spore cortex biosynthesis protein YabQ [Clostridiales bacterium]